MNEKGRKKRKIDEPCTYKQKKQENAIDSLFFAFFFFQSSIRFFFIIDNIQCIQEILRYFNRKHQSKRLCIFVFDSINLQR